MKKFKLIGMDFECDDKYNYATIDEDGSFWVYVDNPKITQGVCWESTAEMLQIFPNTDDIVNHNWKESKIEI